jgi:hypothetical protein
VIFVQAQTRPVLCIVDWLVLIQENWLDAGRFKAFPAVSVWPDFEACQ